MIEKTLWVTLALACGVKFESNGVTALPIDLCSVYEYKVTQKDVNKTKAENEVMCKNE